MTKKPKKQKWIQVRTPAEKRRFVQLLGDEIEAGTIHRVADGARAAAGGPCEDACRDEGGVDLCGETVVLCSSGESFILAS